MYFTFVLFISTSAFAQRSEVNEDSFSHHSVLREFLSRESKGAFLASSPWLVENVQNPERIPAYDSAILVTEYSYTFLDSVSNVVRYKVLYIKLADIIQDSAGFKLMSDQKEETVIIELTNIKNKWKISSPIQRSHVYPNYISHLLSPGQLDKLKDF